MSTYVDFTKLGEKIQVFVIPPHLTAPAMRGDEAAIEQVRRLCPGVTFEWKHEKLWAHTPPGMTCRLVWTEDGNQKES